MSLKRKNVVNVLIDKLTNSIENVQTGETFDTEIVKLFSKDLNLIIRKDWQFNWGNEIRDKTKEVYKLSTINNPKIIQGLVSVEYKNDHIFMHLVESANLIKEKKKFIWEYRVIWLHLHVNYPFPLVLKVM